MKNKDIHLPDPCQVNTVWQTQTHLEQWGTPHKETHTYWGLGFHSRQYQDEISSQFHVSLGEGLAYNTKKWRLKNYALLENIRQNMYYFNTACTQLFQYKMLVCICRWITVAKNFQASTCSNQDTVIIMLSVLKVHTVSHNKQSILITFNSLDIIHYLNFFKNTIFHKLVMKFFETEPISDKI